MNSERKKEPKQRSYSGEEEFEKNSQRSKGDLGQLYQFWKGELRLGKTKERTVRSHKIKKKGIDTAFEEPRGLRYLSKTNKVWPNNWPIHAEEIV